MASEFHRDGPWDLPEGWVWARLGDVVALRGEKTPPNPASPFPFVGMDDVPTNSLRIETMGEFRAMKSAGNKFYANDILYGRLRPYLNKVVVADIEGVASGEFIVMHAPDGVVARYLQLFLHSRYFVNLAMSDTSGDRPRIDFDKIAAVEIPIAPTAEQRRIVARIDELFAEIADGETLLARARDDLDTWRRALLKAAVTGELTREWREQNPSNETGQDVVARLRQAISATVGTFTRRNRRAAAHDQIEIDLAELPELPHGWNWSRVGEIGHVTGGLTKNPDRASVTQKLPYLRVANVQYGELDLTNIKELGVEDSELDRVLLHTNDLLIVEGNGSVDQIGRCAIWAGEIDPCVHQNHIIKARFNDPKIAYWAFHWLMSPHGRQVVTKVASSTSGLHTLSISKIEALPIPICPSEELVQILHVLATEADDEGTIEVELGEGTKSLGPLRQAVLKTAFQGRLAEQDPCDEPADRLLARLREQSEATPFAHRSRGRRAAFAAE